MKVEFLFITPDAEKLIETAGRTSHLSFDKQGKDPEKDFIRMLIKNGHLSVLEHAYATFRISGVSRTFTHQLVRHNKRLMPYVTHPNPSLPFSTSFMPRPLNKFS